jgi:hypothetical protein
MILAKYIKETRVRTTATVVPFPTDLTMCRRVHVRCPDHDPREFLVEVLAGYPVSTVDFGPANALWVRDAKRLKQAGRRWDGLPVRVLGTLFVVCDNT